MSRKRQMIRGAFWSALSIGVSMLAMLLVGKVVTNALAPAVVAIYALLRLGSDFFILLNNFGIAVALPKVIGATEASQRKELLAKIFWGQCLVSAFFCLCLFGLWWALPIVPALGAWHAVWPFVWLMLALVFVGTLRDTLLAGLAGMNAYGLRALGIVFMGLAQVALIFGALWFWPESVAGVCMALAIGYGGGVVLMCLAGGIPVRLTHSLAAFLDASRFSFPLYVNTIVAFFALRFDTVLVGVILGKEYLGIIAIYEMAKNIPMLLSRGLNALLIPFLPNFSELLAQGDKKKAGELLNHVLPLTAFAGYACMFSVVLVQETVLRLLFSEEYVAASSVLGLLLVGMTLAVQAGLMGQALIALGQTWRVTLANALIAGLSIAANIALIPRLGIVGAGWAMVLSFGLGYALLYVWVSRAGIALSIKAVALPQFCLAAGALILFWQPDALWTRGVALLCFLALSFALGVIRVGDIKEWITAMTSRK